MYLFYWIFHQAKVTFLAWQCLPWQRQIKKMYPAYLSHYKAGKDIEADWATDWPSIQDCNCLVSKSLDAQLQTASKPSKTKPFDTSYNKTTSLSSNSLTVSPSLIA